MKYLVYDIGGTDIKYAVMDEHAEFIMKEKRPNRMRSKEDFMEMVDEIYREHGEGVGGIAFSLPGKIDNERGYAYTSGNLNYLNETAVAEMLEARFGIPVTIENDAKAAAWAEIWKGNLMTISDAVVMVIGTGLGGAIVLDRKVRRGARHSAGEFSFIYAGNPGDEGKAMNFSGYHAGVYGFIHPVAKAKGIPMEEVDGYRIFEWILEKDPVTLEIFRGYMNGLCAQICNLQVIYDPEVILIGGGISKQPVFIEMLRETLSVYHEKLAIHLDLPNLDVCRFHNDANLIGALYNFLMVKQKKEAARIEKPIGIS
ncbi:MAG TPA: ROK family protein [Clostridiaceae bacterium]|nr:ROK family protein [Clostridiaceae bacterium]